MKLSRLNKDLDEFSRELSRARSSTDPEKVKLPTKETEEIAFQILRKIVSAAEPAFSIENESEQIKTKQLAICCCEDWIELFFERCVYEDKIALINYLGVAIRPDGSFTYYGDVSSYVDGERESISGTIIHQKETTTNLEEIIIFVNRYFTKK